MKEFIFCEKFKDIMFGYLEVDDLELHNFFNILDFNYLLDSC